jgi:hypothetical protein
LIVFYADHEADAAALRAALQNEGVLATFEPSAIEGQWLIKA